MVGDPIANLINNLKTANLAGRKSISLSYSRMKESILSILKQRGFIANVSVSGKDTGRTFEIELAYDGKSPRISDARRISKFGRRMYRKSSLLRPVKNGFGLVVLSTPKGVLSGEDAKKENVGGEVLFEIW